MPIHNWNAVSDGMFHWFHQRWVAAISDWLNQGKLPEGYYAIGELYADGHFPDVLAIEDRPPEDAKTNGRTANGFGVAVAETPPKTRFSWEAKGECYLGKKNMLAVRNVGGTLVAVIEVMSPGNKSSTKRLQEFVDKTMAFLDQGIHVLVVDLFPPTTRDPLGIHHAIWTKYEGDFDFKPDKPLTLASYQASCGDAIAKAFVEPVATGETLPVMPLFLWPDRYVNVDLEASYAAAWAVYPAPLKPRIEAAK